jgi:DNA processing protein
MSPPVVIAAEPIDARSLEDRLADLLGPAPVGLDDLVRASGASAGQVQAVLLDLELQGRANRRGNLVTS